jgi:hypothetical protein
VEADGVERRLVLTTVALVGVALLTGASVAAKQSALYTRAATRSCLLRLPGSIAGLPPAQPPSSRAFFVYPLRRDDLSTATFGPRPRPHSQLGAWWGARKYRGIFFSFFKRVPDARASLKSLAPIWGGGRIRNVVITWDHFPPPSLGLTRSPVLGCLRSRAAGVPSARPAPAATLATFAGEWGGHTRHLSVAPTGRGHEAADDGCCTRVYRMTFRILSVRGTVTRATAVYRVTSFRRFQAGMKGLQVGDVGKFLLRNGIVTNSLTHDYFCSDPAWGATGACGA